MSETIMYKTILIFSGVLGGGARGACAPGATLGGGRAEIDLVAKKMDQNERKAM